MKKILGIIVLGLLLSGNAYANDTIKLGMSFYEVREILKNQFGEKLRGNYPLKNTSKKYLNGQIKINDKIDFYEFYYDGAKKINKFCKICNYKKYKLVKISKNNIEFYNYYLNIPNIKDKDKAELLKYKNMGLRSKAFAEKQAKDKEQKIKSEALKEQNDLATMIEKAKITCQTLGFEKGTDKFSDCTLKLYTQEVDNKVAIEVAKQKSKASGSSNSGTMVIYDPVRDRQNKIDKGMEMITGRCTLGTDC
jgi:hypothetical protein